MEVSGSENINTEYNDLQQNHCWQNVIICAAAIVSVEPVQTAYCPEVMGVNVFCKLPGFHHKFSFLPPPCLTARRLPVPFLE